MNRQYDHIDELISALDNGLRTVFGRPVANRQNPANQGINQPPLAEQSKKKSAEMMRVNHAGEICAQALYQGQALTARDLRNKDAMRQAALEENDHLAWCEQRLQELGEDKSRLTPAWYLGSFLIGSLAGIAGDKWSLGFLAETERQVVDHLDNHLQHLPQDDHRSRAILEQMKLDEGEHATQAVNAGAEELPETIKKLMNKTSKIMTTVAAKI